MCVCLFIMQVVNPCDKLVPYKSHDQADGATFPPLLEQVLESAHRPPLESG